MQVLLENKTGAVRVIYELDGRTKTIPPGAPPVSVNISEGMHRQLKRAEQHGDKFFVRPAIASDLHYANGQVPAYAEPIPDLAAPEAPAPEPEPEITQHEFQDAPVEEPAAPAPTKPSRASRARSNRPRVRRKGQPE